MAKIYQLEDHIKSVLQQKAETIQVPPDLFARINKKLTINPALRRQGKSSLICCRVAVITIIMSAVTGIMLMTFSREARVMAAKVIDSIKTIFVVKKVAGHYRAIVKPVAELQLSQGLCKKLFGVDDISLGQKVGFKVVYPESLSGYKLDFKGIGVKLDKKMDVETFRQLRARIEKAFDDDQTLRSLKIYDAHRYSGARYHKGETIIGIYVEHCAYRITHNIKKKVTFRGCKGFWLEHPRHQYFNDKHKEAESLQVRHSLYWVKNGLGFYLRSEGETDLTYNEALRIAALFSEAY
jgi:hypothetical protein